MAKKVVTEEPAQEELVVPTVEETSTNTGGQSTRAYRSFAVPFGAAVAESMNNPVQSSEAQPEVQADGEQEEPQV